MNNSIFSFPKIFSEFKNSLFLALPLIATELVYAINGFVSTLMIAHLGKNQLAASALVWDIYLALILFFIGILNSISVMIAQSFGAKDTKGITIIFKQGLILAIICSIPMMLIMQFAPLFLSWTDQDPIVLVYTKPYFHVLIWSMLPLNLVFSIEQFLVGISKMRLVMFMSLSTTPLTILFNYIFLFGKFGFPQLGLASLGYSALAVQCLLAIGFGFYFHFAKNLRKYKLFSRWWIINRKFLLEMIRIGLPLGFMYCVELLFFAAVAIMMGVLGTNTLAAYQISYQFLMIPLVILFALTQTVTVRVGNEIGKNDRNAIKLSVIVNMAIGFAIMILFSFIYFEFPLWIINMDVNVHAAEMLVVVDKTIKFLVVISILILTEVFRLLSFGALRALKDIHFSMFNSLLGFWIIAFPIAYLLAFKFKFDGIGIWWGMVIGLGIAGIILCWRFCYLVKHVNLKRLVTMSE